jgi:hypothetical protein
MDRWTPNEAAIQAEKNKEAKQLELTPEVKYGHNPHRVPTAASSSTPGSSDYVRLRGLREPGYYVLYDD